MFFSFTLSRLGGQEVEDKGFLDECRDLGFFLKADQEKRFDLYRDRIIEWNQRINITRISAPEEINRKHFLDSLSIFRLIDLPSSASVVDIGSGGGFPGIPMEIWNPDFTMTLVDSLNKRILFLAQVIQDLGLEKTQAVHGRAEDLFQDSRYREGFDLAVSRALAPLPTLLEYALPAVKVGGSIIAMKGPGGAKELDESKKAISVLGGSVGRVDTFTWTKDSYQRTLIEIIKMKETPPDYPRGRGRAKKNPLV